MMPPLKLLRHVIDKMKNIADILCIEANMVICITFLAHVKNGELLFKVETETVTIQTKYSNLEHPQIGLNY